MNSGYAWLRGRGPVKVIGLVLEQGMKLVMAGIGLGAAAGWALSRTLQGFIGRLGEFHWGLFGVTVALLVAVTMAACWLPARRATRVEPAAALRA